MRFLHAVPLFPLAALFVAANAAEPTMPADTLHASTSKSSNTVAVLAFTGKGLDAKDLAAVTSRFESELHATDSFRIATCADGQCSEIGQIPTAGRVFTGELSKVGNTWSLFVKQTDAGTGRTLFSHVLDVQGALDDVLRGGCPVMAQIASGRKTSDITHIVLVTEPAPRIWPWVAGGLALAGGATIATILLTEDNSSSSNGSGSTNSSSTPDQLIVRW